MRDVLNYPQIDEQKLDMVKKLIDIIAEKPYDCSRELSELNHITGKFYTAMSFVEYWGWTDLDVLAKTTLVAEPPRIDNLTKEEIKEIVWIAKNCLVSGEDDKADYYMELLHKSLPLSNVAHYIMSGDDEETIADKMIQASSGSVIAL